MISMNQLRNGVVLKIDGELFQIIDCQHVKPGKGGAFARTKLKNLRLGNTMERTMRDSEKLEDAFVETRPAEYLYHDGTHYFFMDQENYEQMMFAKEQIGEAAYFLTDNMPVNLQVYNGQLISVVLPASVTLKIITTDPGVRGDTAKAGTKPATLETGLVVSVPLFIDSNDVIKVDTRTKDYLGRA